MLASGCNGGFLGQLFGAADTAGSSAELAGDPEGGVSRGVDTAGRSEQSTSSDEASGDGDAELADSGGEVVVDNGEPIEEAVWAHQRSTCGSYTATAACMRGAAAEVYAARVASVPADPVCTDVCRTANNGQCDDLHEGNESCPLGSDCADCGPAPRAIVEQVDTKLLQLTNHTAEKLCFVKVGGHRFELDPGEVQLMDDVPEGRLQVSDCREPHGFLVDRPFELGVHTEVHFTNADAQLDAPASAQRLIVDVGDPAANGVSALRVINQSRHPICQIGVFQSAEQAAGGEEPFFRVVRNGDRSPLPQDFRWAVPPGEYHVRMAGCGDETGSYLYRSERVRIAPATALFLHDRRPQRVGLSASWERVGARVRVERCASERLQGSVASPQCARFVGQARRDCEARTRRAVDLGSVHRCF